MKAVVNQINVTTDRQPVVINNARNTRHGLAISCPGAVLREFGKVFTQETHVREIVDVDWLTVSNVNSYQTARANTENRAR